jgi:hypothetical protein
MRTLINRVRIARSTAAKYSSKASLRRCIECLGAVLPCSTPFGDNPARGSGRRGRRFKSCHPDRVSAGQRPLPELVRASLAACTATKYRQYRNKSEHLTCSSDGFPKPAQRFAGTKRPQARTMSPRPEVPQVIPEGKGQKSTRRGSPACVSLRGSPLGWRSDRSPSSSTRLRSTGPHDHARVDFQGRQHVSQVRLAS